jgi:hypothetical protein
MLGECDIQFETETATSADTDATTTKGGRTQKSQRGGKK